MMNPEKDRLQLPEWKKWGPYLSDRQWGTVREDYSKDGKSWLYTTHDEARSKAYRWGCNLLCTLSGCRGNNCCINNGCCHAIYLYKSSH